MRQRSSRGTKYGSCCTSRGRMPERPAWPSGGSKGVRYWTGRNSCSGRSGAGGGADHGSCDPDSSSSPHSTTRTRYGWFAWGGGTVAMEGEGKVSLLIDSSSFRKGNIV